MSSEAIPTLSFVPFDIARKQQHSDILGTPEARARFEEYTRFMAASANTLPASDVLVRGEAWRRRKAGLKCTGSYASARESGASLASPLLFASCAWATRNMHVLKSFLNFKKHNGSSSHDSQVHLAAPDRDRGVRRDSERRCSFTAVAHEAADIAKWKGSIKGYSSTNLHPLLHTESGKPSGGVRLTQEQKRRTSCYRLRTKLRLEWAI